MPKKKFVHPITFVSSLIRQSFRMSMQNIISNKLRSFLTMLGIIIGVGAVIGLITIVQGATDSVIGQFEGLGVDVLSVSAYGTTMKHGLSDTDIDLIRNVEGVDGVSPTASLTTSAVFEGEVYKKVNISGKDTTYFSHNDMVEEGRAFNEADMDGDSYVCIVDSKFISKVLYGKKVLGQTIKLHGSEYTIIGILKKDDSLFAAMADTSGSDGSVMVPYKNALNMAGAANVTSLEVYVASGFDMSECENGIRTVLENIFNGADGSYSVFNMSSLMDAMNEITGMMSTMLAGIASIALLVGGIGIMNMMLVSVSERTKEIGLRKALGAEPFRIQAQFLIESIVLSVFGGILGILFGMLIAFIVSVALETAFSISPGAILLGFGFSLAVGVIFGWMPAKRASELNPIDALRSE